jgi:hypothetical protein
LLGDQTPPLSSSTPRRANNSSTSQKIKKARETSTEYAERASGFTLHTYLENRPHSTVRKVPTSSSCFCQLKATLTSKSPSQQLQTVLLFTLRFAASPHPMPPGRVVKKLQKTTTAWGDLYVNNKSAKRCHMLTSTKERLRNTPELFSANAKTRNANKAVEQRQFCHSRDFPATKTKALLFALSCVKDVR